MRLLIKYYRVRTLIGEELKRTLERVNDSDVYWCCTQFQLVNEEEYKDTYNVGAFSPVRLPHFEHSTFAS